MTVALHAPTPPTAARAAEPGLDLTDRLRRGEEAALTECYRDLGPAVLAYLQRQVGHPDAEDLLQQVFLELWLGVERLDPGRAVAPWLFTVARRRAVDHLRRRRQVALSLDRVGEPAGSDHAERVSELATLRGLLDGLPAEQRQALRLAYFEGHTQREIAQRLQVPLGTVKARTSRGLRRLAVQLGQAATR